MGGNMGLWDKDCVNGDVGTSREVDNRQRNMPLPDDRIPPRGQALAYPEAVLLVNPIEPELKRR
ncbi:rhamnogalacturonate lyase B-like, partial [Trifolium medium]|nr:rhamnogalacturonate lyase B-like [Trifolium medium]